MGLEEWLRQQGLPVPPRTPQPTGGDLAQQLTGMIPAITPPTLLPLESLPTAEIPVIGVPVPDSADTAPRLRIVAEPLDITQPMPRVHPDPSLQPTHKLGDLPPNFDGR